MPEIGLRSRGGGASSAQLEAAENVAEQFESMEQQKEAATQGMWLFLSTELLLFGGLFVAYVVYRVTYPEAFERAGHEFNIVYGSLNTAILLTSSLTMALSVQAAEQGKRWRLTALLLLTALIGLLFLGIKGLEYREDFQKQLVPGADLKVPGGALPPMRILVFLYYVMTGLHAIHLTLAIGLVAVTAAQAAFGKFSKGYHNQVENVGLYWHFVDLVWVFLYPMLYLMGRGSS